MIPRSQSNKVDPLRYGTFFAKLAEELARAVYRHKQAEETKDDKQIKAAAHELILKRNDVGSVIGMQAAADIVRYLSVDRWFCRKCELPQCSLDFDGIDFDVCIHCKAKDKRQVGVDVISDATKWSKMK